jgi:hypothetical protein
MRRPGRPGWTAQGGHALNGTGAFDHVADCLQGPVGQTGRAEGRFPDPAVFQRGGQLRRDRIAGCLRVVEEVHGGDAEEGRQQRDRAWQALNEIPGVSCVKPQGAIYAFPRIDPGRHPIRDDERLVLDLLLREKIHVVQGTGFNWPRPDHIRIVTLPSADELDTAIRRIGRFLDSYRQ